MKKTLAALAVLGAFAGSAMAADVTLYGAIDQGLSYVHQDTKKFDGTKAKDGVDTLEMASGIDTPSRWGVKGVEDLGNGYKVGFKLEGGINTDDGTMGQDDRLFGREAALTVYGPFGELAFGRMGGIASSAGTYDMLAYVESFDGGDNVVWGFDASDRYDNMITYATPRVAGLQGVVQYSFKTDSKAERDDKKTMTEGESTAERYLSVGVSGEYGPAQFALGYELTKYSTLDRVAADEYEPDDHNLFFIGGNYDFGVAKVFAMGQYFNGLTTAPTVVDDALVTSDNGTNDGVKGFGFHLGTQVPAAGGLITVGGYYSNFEQDGVKAGKDKLEGDYYGLAARYEYDLSKRTMLYAGAGYGVESRDKVGTDKDDTQNQLVQAYVGLTHRF